MSPDNRIENAVRLALKYGTVDGAHHKMWVIDQMVRVLTGPEYGEFVRSHNKGEDGPDTYSWDEGIAP